MVLFNAGLCFLGAFWELHGARVWRLWTKNKKCKTCREQRGQSEYVGGPALRAHSRREAVPPASLAPLQRQLAAGQRMLGVQGDLATVWIWCAILNVHERKFSPQCGNDDGGTFKETGLNE